MTQTGSRPIAVFGDADLEIWGVLILDQRPRLALAGLDADAVELVSAAVDRDDDQIWTVTAGKHTLRIEMGEAQTGTPGHVQSLTPVRVTGSATIGTTVREIDVAGVLTDGEIGSGNDSLRLFASWFPAGHQVVLRSARPHGVKGHDRDIIDVAALGEEEPVVFDPHLSTTYNASSAPLQAGLELWIGADEEGDQYPRRVAGVPTGSVVRDSGSGTKLDAHAMTCLSRAEIGTGVYVLLRAA